MPLAEKEERVTRVKVLETNHTGITVQDLDYSIKFFTEVLGYVLIGERAPRGLANQEKVTGVKGCNVEIAYVKGGGHAIELLQYNGPEDRQVYKPRCVDVGHWHLSINIEDIDIATEEALKFGCTKVGGQITVDGGPNKGNKIQYIAAKDGMIVEMTWIANRG
jgi:catechol 2,3-dioxygenase-like lactoylglutathione lyase family enzyme